MEEGRVRRRDEGKNEFIPRGQRKGLVFFFLESLNLDLRAKEVYGSSHFTPENSIFPDPSL